MPVSANMPASAENRRLGAACCVVLAGLSTGVPGQPSRAGESGPRPVTGPAQVIDAATLAVGSENLALHGIDAPSYDQTCFDAQERRYACGRVAARALAERIGDQSVVCEPRGLGRNGIRSARCRIGGDDLGAWMVENGHAVADRTMSDAYLIQDARAWGRRIGLWSGVFQMPAEWRRVQGLSVGL